jgi:hypothetical protein
MASLPEMRRSPIYAADIRQLGGVVSVHTDRDRCDGEPIFRVSHISGGGDVAFLSMPMMLEDHAAAAARVLAEFVGGKTAKTVPNGNDLQRTREMQIASP